MIKNKPVLIFITILIAVIIIAISVVVSSYNKNKPITPDMKYIGVMSSQDMIKIKAKYDLKENKKTFLRICETIELAVTNKLLDGTVTNDDELEKAIKVINDMFKTDDWTYLGLEYPSYWMGQWQLDNMGLLYFSFESNDIKPDWAGDEEVKKYIK